MNKIEEMYQIIKNSKNIVLFTGAGISVPSGIPDFRSSTGIYVKKYDNRFDVETVLSYNFFIKHKEVFYKYYKENLVHTDVLPNKAHKYFASLEKQNILKAVITQNIDGLHQLSGSKNVLELHGTIYDNYCMKCGKRFDVKKIISEEIPYCDCGGLIKPGIVLYGDLIDENTFYMANKYISTADTLIVVGTSLKVQPAAGLIRSFKGENLIIINKEKLSTAIYRQNYLHFNVLEINSDIIDVVNELEKLND